MAARNLTKSVGEKLSKSEKKALRKQARKVHSLSKHNSELADVSIEPTPHILVGNGGLMCGVDRESITRVFSLYGTLERVVMLPQRSYSFVSYKSHNNALNAMRNLNGKALDEFGLRSVFYLSYLVKVPSDVILSKIEHPPGLQIYEEFINEEEEKTLLDALGWDAPQKELRHRRVKHYGYEFLYGTNDIDRAKPLPGGMPAVCNDILTRMVSQGAVQNTPDQLTVNEYLPGQGIPPHVDTHSAFEDGICSLSLGAKISMDFRHPDSRHVSVLLPRRSLLVMSGESRYLWTHGITPRKFDIIGSGLDTSIHEDQESIAADASNVSTSGVTQYERERRISLTFRKILHVPCTCKYSSKCNSQGYKKAEDKNAASLPSTQGEAQSLEKRHVHEVYENIADHFSDTRHSPWPRIAAFLRELPTGSLVADVGCGNGKYLGINGMVFKTGSDRSFNLATIAYERGHSVIVCDILSLPYRNNAFDVCLCIAVIHHLSTTERRIAALRELVRIIRPAGLALVYVWALEQELEKVKKSSLREVMQGRSDNTAVQDFSTSQAQSDQTDDRDFIKQGVAGHVEVNVSRGEFKQQDLFVPWKFRGASKKESNGADTVFHRFYHVFKEGELLELCRCLDNVVVKDSYYDRGNWCAVIEKIC
ncbi:predicted protein [Nematostella vectensis]|uniref:tRNA (carboxymethyluridine(34)-5-O)-methyltransferase n=1 Tax=Nematostella vectensis TaxID=45351 RepID=A7SSH3_NEMVE|nr:predicted protein [Nematostella vectensis]|eukprot:XP_001625438.1 predicted protein [Nematostella vectensis]